MKAKEKAKELVEKYEYNGVMIDDIRMSEEEAKQCALICVDEILNAPQIGSGWLNKYDPYWTQVKQEINKL